MRQLEKHEIEKARMLKVARAAIRLKHACNADDEIYERIPVLEQQINDALSRGEPLELTVAQMLGDNE